MSDLVVSAVSIAADTIELSFMQVPGDYRDVAGSPVAMLRTVVLARSSEAYGDDIEALVSAAEALAADVLEDWDTAQPVPTDTVEDDDRGMGE